MNMFKAVICSMFVTSKYDYLKNAFYDYKIKH